MLMFSLGPHFGEKRAATKMQDRFNWHLPQQCTLYFVSACVVLPWLIEQLDSNSTEAGSIFVVSVVVLPGACPAFRSDRFHPINPALL
jgi:hypothetical protein